MIQMTNEEAIRTMGYFDRNFGSYKPNHEAIQMAIEALFAQPERKNGKWINVHISASGDSDAECNLCGAVVHTSFSDQINYCPNCGAKME